MKYAISSAVLCVVILLGANVSGNVIWLLGCRVLAHVDVPFSIKEQEA
jgi:hypothetical protein